MNAFTLPVLGFAAWSGTGKTTLLKQLLPRLKQRGLRVGCIKHAHHAFDVDIPGKDSYELRHAGAMQMLIASDQRWALMTEEPRSEAPALSELLQRLDTAQLDMVLVEGFKAEHYPKIELYRAVVGKPMRCQDDPAIVAIATDDPASVPVEVQLPVLDINDISAIEAFVCHFCQTYGGQG
ncbi:MAG: molybdopterin-guanine dinucleotide biosynthesis protein MobB [Nitrincola lacisaponensis]|uniref:molybdopterin-guanine dinucleotide biosynthesis protein MobB n=1 Tax=Nitrincola lacisaponensis TaxID=267850 RepID=UPI00391904C1